jgi:hypothetical protein
LSLAAAPPAPHLPPGRNFSELLRCLDALRLSAKFEVRAVGSLSLPPPRLRGALDPPAAACVPLALVVALAGLPACARQVGTPVNWQTSGDVVILPSVSEADALKLFPKGFFALTPYLRLTEMPEEDE